MPFMVECYSFRGGGTQVMNNTYGKSPKKKSVHTSFAVGSEEFE